MRMCLCEQGCKGVFWELVFISKHHNCVFYANVYHIMCCYFYLPSCCVYLSIYCKCRGVSAIKIATAAAFVCPLTQLLACLSASTHLIAPKAIFSTTLSILSHCYSGKGLMVNDGNEIIISIVRSNEGK